MVSDAPPPWRPRTLVERVGAALIAPHRAMAAADQPAAAGRTASDAALLMLVSVLALYTFDLARAVLLGVHDSVVVGASALLALVGRALGPDLVLLLVGTAVVTVAAGRRRSLGRDFDLACVAYVPFVAVGLAAQLLALTGVLALTPTATRGGGAVGYGWACALLGLAVWKARRRG